MANKKTNKRKIRETSKELITKEMPIGEVVYKHPNTISVFIQHGLHCIGCGVAQFESIEQGAAAHGIDVKKLMMDLNKAAAKKAK